MRCHYSPVTTLLSQMGIKFFKAAKMQSRREQVISKRVNLLLNLTLLVAASRGTCCWINQEMRCKSKIPIIKYPFSASTYPCDNCFQIIVNTSLAKAFKKIVRLNMCFKNHLHRLAWKYCNKWHPAITKFYMSNLYCYWYSA